MKDPWFQMYLGVQMHNPAAPLLISVCQDFKEKQSAIRRRKIVRRLVLIKLRMRKAIAVIAVAFTWIVFLTVAIAPPLLFNFAHGTAFIWGLLMGSSSITVSTILWHKIVNRSYVKHKGRKYYTYY